MHCAVRRHECIRWLAEKEMAPGARAEAQQIIALIEAEWPRTRRRNIGRAGARPASSRRTGRPRSAGMAPPGVPRGAVEIEPLAGVRRAGPALADPRLHHRADRVHWLAVLARGRGAGLCLADLHALAGTITNATIWSLMNDVDRIGRLSADGRRRLVHVREVLAEALAGQGRQRRRRWVEDAWKKLGGPACLGGATEAADAQAYFNRLDALDAAGRFVLDSLEDDMDRLYARPMRRPTAGCS